MRALVIFLLWAPFFFGVSFADESQSAIASSQGIAINANNRSQVTVNASRQTSIYRSQADVERIRELEADNSRLILEVSRLSYDEESEIIKRTREQMLNSLPPEVRSKYDGGDSRAVIKYLEGAHSRIQESARKANSALSKASYEIALIEAQSDYLRAYQTLKRALREDPENLEAIALSVQLANSMGRNDEAYVLVKDLLARGIQSHDLRYVSDVENIASRFYLFGLMVMVEQGKVSDAKLLAREGVEFSNRFLNKGAGQFAELKAILIFQLRLIETFEEDGNIRDYRSLLLIVDGIRADFVRDCRGCWGVVAMSAGYDLMGARMLLTYGDFDAANIRIFEVEKLLNNKDLPLGLWFQLRSEFLRTLALSAQLSENHEKFREYIDLAKEHLKKGVDGGSVPHEKWFDILDLDIEFVTSCLADNLTVEADRRVNQLVFELSIFTKRLPGYEKRFFTSYLKVADIQSQQLNKVGADGSYQKAAEYLAKVETNPAELLSLNHSLALSLAYHHLRYQASEQIGRQIELLADLESKLFSMEKKLDPSALLELEARHSLLNGSCSKFQSFATRALAQFEEHGKSFKHEEYYADRLRRLLHLSLLCLDQGEVSSERHYRLYAFAEAQFERRPWSSELISDIVYSITGLVANSREVKGLELVDHYFDLLRKHMLQCSRYKNVRGFCLMNAAYALGSLGIGRLPSDKVISEKARAEFSQLIKESNRTTALLTRHISFTTIYANFVNRETDITLRRELLAEALRSFELIPEAERSESMKKWAIAAGEWLGAGKEREFPERLWFRY